MPFIINAECCARFITTCYVKLALFILGHDNEFETVQENNISGRNTKHQKM